MVTRWIFRGIPQTNPLFNDPRFNFPDQLFAPDIDPDSIFRCPRIEAGGIDIVVADQCMNLNFDHVL